MEKAFGSASFAFEVVNEHLPKLDGSTLRTLAQTTPETGDFWLDALYYAYELEAKFKGLCEARALEPIA